MDVLCRQHGPAVVAAFSKGQAIVGFNQRDDAVKAFKSLNGCTVMGSTISVEFVNEADVMRLLGVGDGVANGGGMPPQQQQQHNKPVGWSSAGGNAAQWQDGGAASWGQIED